MSTEENKEELKEEMIFQSSDDVVGDSNPEGPKLTLDEAVRLALDDIKKLNGQMAPHGYSQLVMECLAANGNIDVINRVMTEEEKPFFDNLDKIIRSKARLLRRNKAESND